ncbi:GGDEF domain-containing phosphodiesterase [Marinomonas pollencensis]|uniref:Diguanylate cyclase/phosphodiesterase n=1 Tax=Marinomonas pollencensis TaxID=491954 RepID=A0A3E0DKD2_9GAMM|nr:GGDEF domain-containing phosphodiesterase [Marinomonas pollencensis]REG81940.1 diguanylate cyclase/phosphodiesterase [Marinomonas pollencensis]
MLIDFFKAYFLVDSDQLSQYDKSTFQQSALRILITFTSLVFLGVELNSLFITSVAESELFLVINSLCLALLVGLLFFCKKYTQISSLIFLSTLTFIGLSLVTLSNDAHAAKYGLISLYSLPLMARLLFNFRFSLLLSFANLGSFYLIVSGSHSLEAHTSTGVVPAFTSFYFQILTFVTLNFALPFAVSRIMYTLEHNTTHLESLYRRLNRNYSLYEEIFEHTGNPTILCNKYGKVLKANRSAHHLLGLNETDKIENSKIQSWLMPLNKKTERYFWQSNAVECALKRDTDVFIEVHRATLTNHGHYMLHLQNITHLKAMKQELVNSQETNSRLVHFDALTRLPNFQNFCNQVNRKIKQETNHYTGAMFIIRISQFKLLNKQYGKDNANRIILSFAKTLQSKLSDQTIISRLRGVKFACFLPLGQAYLIQRNLSALIKSVLPEHIRMDGKVLNIDFQVGIAYYQNDGQTAEQLLEHCEMALEYSNSVERYSYYDHQLENKLVQEHQLGLQLGDAIKRNDIALWLQPQVSPDGQVCSFEALARWQKADGNFVSPFVFIAVAEKLGLLPTLAENLLRSLIPVLQDWHDEHIRTPVAFNLAGQELMNDAFFALLMSLAADHSWLSDMLELEITETSPVMTNPLIHKRLKALHQYGFVIAIDDFGTGQATMGQLIDIPATVLKIDRRFVSPLPDDQRHLDIVKSTIQLARSLDMKVIAEGIETKEQANLLIALGCNTLQGYYFAKPAPMTDWTNNNHQKAKELRMVY